MTPRAPPTSRVLLVVPCFNEEGSIGKVLGELTALGPGYDAVVIDDASTDGTLERARGKCSTIRLVHNLGIGGAVQTGIKLAARRGYDFCIQTDGDGQHPPGEIVRLLDAYRAKPANIIIGSRFLRHRWCHGFRSSFARRVGSLLIAQVLQRLFYCDPITDPTSGMRLMDRAAIAFFNQRYPQDFPEAISLAWALRSGLTVAETAVEMRSRYGGTSSIHGLRPLSYMIRVLGYIMLARIARAT